MPKSQVNAGDEKPKVVRSQQLFEGNSVLLIQHGDQQYQLRITKENKLILTK